MDFGSFLQQQNLVGLSLSFLVAFSTMDTTKGFTRSIIMPLIEAIKTLKAPQFAFGYLIEGLFNFVITMLVVFFMLKLTSVNMPPAQIVQVMTR
jgi:large-conductance mechanosensitive channel